MEPEALHRIAAGQALELPGSELVHPFGPEHDVFKVRGKVFLLLSTVRGTAVATLKSDPEIAAELCRSHSWIAPGYHMNKRHWISLSATAATSGELTRDLVTDSYLAVVEKLPRARRPVDPFTYGGRRLPGED